MSQTQAYQTDETRDKILQQARTCFSLAGFFATQMKDVASAAGMSRNTLYRYFPNKVELAMAILERALDLLLTIAQRSIGISTSLKICCYREQNPWTNVF